MCIYKEKGTCLLATACPSLVGDHGLKVNPVDLTTCEGDRGINSATDAGFSQAVVTFDSEGRCAGDYRIPLDSDLPERHGLILANALQWLPEETAAEVAGLVTLDKVDNFI